MDEVMKEVDALSDCASANVVPYLSCFLQRKGGEPVRGE
jgi:hypothetical protein